MNVFAEYILENGIKYRKRTLLQFGDSWNLIGSAVLKNPGSALPIEGLSENEKSRVQEFVHSGKFNSDQWYRFQPDQTMRVLSRIFDGGLVGPPNELNGVIQLYNLIDLQDPDILQVQSKVSKISSSNLKTQGSEIIDSFQGKPVYLGWFDLWKIIPETKELALEIFNYVKMSPHCYFDTDFENSKFYHPLYVNRSYKREWVKPRLNLFIELLGKQIEPGPLHPLAESRQIIIGHG